MTLYNANKPQTIFAKAAARLAKTKVVPKRRESQKLAAIEKPDIDLSSEAAEILERLENTSVNVFLTGKAGTGKSTLLKYFRSTTKKKVVVLAPTGVAAVNVQGQTIHSFFKFGPHITYDSVKKRSPGESVIYKEVDIIIIDEISMVRADLFDCVDKFMRLNGPDKDAPFGGVQMLVIGDLYQLPPIVRNDEQYFFQESYESPYFFDSHAYPLAGFYKKELTQVYRQHDPDFIEILDAVRTGGCTPAQLGQINARVTQTNTITDDEFIISLVSKNSMADTINATQLTKLPGTPRAYKGITTGDFSDKDFPTPMELTLKEGAQVMLLNNHPQGNWVNGDVVKVIKTETNSVRVLFDDGSFDDVLATKWDSVRFIYDDDSKKIQPEIVGTFTQLPIRLAWAITIHKSQGKTFDKVRIDFGGGTFAPGQAYVALSRCRTMGGIALGRPVEHRHIFVDDRVREFMD